jgi:diguanylate cyclase (GGDEF)-like protein
VVEVARQSAGVQTKVVKKPGGRRALTFFLWVLAIWAGVNAVVAVYSEINEFTGNFTHHSIILPPLPVRTPLGLAILDLVLPLLGIRILRRRWRVAEERERTSRDEAAFAFATLNALKAHVAILDDAGVVLSVNTAWREFCKEADGSLYRSPVGNNYLISCDLAAGRSDAQAAEIGAALRAVLSGRAEFATAEYCISTGNINTVAKKDSRVAGDGKAARWFSVSVTRFAGDGPARLVVAHDEITARKRAEAEMHSAKEAAEAASQSKSSFLANMSHEIRTPMTAILGYSDMLLAPEHTPQERLKYVRIIRRNGEHLMGIINDILDVSKIEANAMTVERIGCDTRGIIADVISVTRARATQKGLEFKVTTDGEIPARIKTDPLRLKQILVNLVSNAIKFTKEGSVLVRISSEPSVNGGIIQFDICDTGIGLSEEQAAKLFRPFTQADDSNSRRFGGTGLGLTISKRLASLLGGDISVTSIPGKGSTFTVWIDSGPRDEAEMIDDLGSLDEEQIHDDQPANDVRLRARILLAEDGEDNQDLLSMMLRGAGAEVVVAPNGRVALDLATATGARFELILMDMQMPEMDGYHATRELRQRLFTAPIVALTAHATAEERARCLAAGCTDFLSKPVTRAQLLEMVSRHLPMRGDDSTDAGDLAVQLPLASTGTTNAAVLPAISNGTQTIQSTLASAPGMKELLAKFVSRLPERVVQLQALVEAGELEALSKVAHQVKGAAGGYGFADITNAAAIVESRIRTHGDVALIHEDVETLIRLIKQVEGYPRQGASVLHKHRVLLIDDDDAIHGLIGQSLQGTSIDLYCSVDGNSAIAMATSLKPDLILLDLHLGDSHGFELSQKFRSEASTRHIPQIFISGVAGIDTKVEGLNLGAVDYITKPFDIAEARARILAALRAKELQDQLTRNATIDLLTGVGNRRYFDKRAAAELSRARRSRKPLTCVIFDVDHFKSINDAHGHVVGDRVLATLGQLLTSVCRAEDTVCRYGGEEFVILTPGQALEEVAGFAERLRLEIAALEFDVPAASGAGEATKAAAAKFRLTCSFGVSELSDHMSTSTDLVQSADRRLYFAKRTGRNRVVSADPPESPETDQVRKVA